MRTVEKKLWLVLSCFLLLMGVLAGPVSAIEARSKMEVQQEIDQYVKKTMSANHIQGAALAIVHNDEVFYTQGYGAISEGRDINDRTPFPIASLSKSFTALAVLQLADKGLIELDSPYASYFPDLASKDERVRDITVRDLLNQTSGLNDKVNPDMTRSSPYQSLRQVNESLNTVQLANDPGAAYSYHNPNYQYLALLVEKMSRQNFSDYLEDHIFEPLGMRDTFNVSNTRQINENSAIPQGHYILLGHPVSQSEPSWFVDGPAGMISTAEDMSKWMLAQYNGRLLTPELMEQYHTAGQQGPYGMGWLAEEDEQGGRTISHSGILWTYKAEETIYLDQRLGIAMMFDSGLNAFVDYSAFVDGIAKIMKGEKAESRIVNSKNMEAVMILLVLATIAWGIYRLYRIHRSNKAMTTGKWIVSLAGGLLPVLILLFLSPLATFIGAGRVLPWYGLWTAMSSLIIWLVVLSLVNITVIVCRLRLYYQAKKMKGITTSPYPENPSR